MSPKTAGGAFAVRSESELVPNPTPDYRFRTGDVLGVLGTIDQRSAAGGLVRGAGQIGAGTDVRQGTPEPGGA